MSAPPEDPRPHRRPGSRAWPIAGAIVTLAALLAAFLLTRQVLSVPRDTAAWATEAALKLSGLFGAKVHVENSSFTLEQKEIAELAMVERRIVCLTRYDARSWGSNATVIIRGDFRAKAGFDLRQGCRISVAGGRLIEAELPPPQLLSLTTERQQVYFASEGLLQKLGPAEMAEAYAQNLAQAQREAAAPALLQETQNRLQERLSDLLADRAHEVRLRPPATPAP